MSELVLCVPGCWADRSDLLGKIVAVEPSGRYMFAGTILADLHEKDHVELEIAAPDPNLARAFEVAGHGKIPEEIARRIEAHSAVAYLHFPVSIAEHRERILKFGAVLEKAGGLAVKVESAGLAFSWTRWTALLEGSLFDLYSAVVVLVADDRQYYSCGMHHFGLPECAVPRSMPAAEAADLMNRFNFWRIVERPVLADGHTFSPAPESPRFRMTLGADTRHESATLFWNEHGVWSLRS